MSSTAEIPIPAIANKAVALVDVDNTLSIFIDSDDKSLDGFKKSMRRHFRLNEGLITALKQSGVYHLYLFTSMAAKEVDLLLRMALIDVLEEDYQLTVHGVLTPADAQWNAPQESFYHDVDEPLREPDFLEREEIDDESDDLLDNSIHDNSIMWSDSSEKASNPIKAAPVSPLGIAFRALQAALKNKKFQGTAQEYKLAFKRAVEQGKKEQKANIKANVFAHFLQHNPGYQIVFVCDDNQQVLLSVIEGNKNHENTINLNTLYVNNNLTEKDPEQEKEFHSYYALFSLKLLCEAYLAELHVMPHKNDEDEEVLNEKRDAITALILTLCPNENNLADTQKITNFEETLNKHRELLLRLFPSQSGLSMTHVYLAEKLGVTQSREAKLLAQLDQLLLNRKLDLLPENLSFQKKWKKALDDLLEVILDDTKYDDDLKAVGNLIHDKLHQRYFMTSDERLMAISVAELTRLSIIEPHKPEHLNAVAELSHQVSGQSVYWNVINGCLCALAGIIVLSLAMTVLIMTEGLVSPLCLNAATIGTTLLSQGVMAVGDIALLGLGAYALMECWNFFANTVKKGLAKDLTLLGSDLKKHQKSDISKEPEPIAEDLLAPLQP